MDIYFLFVRAIDWGIFCIWLKKMLFLRAANWLISGKWSYHWGFEEHRPRHRPRGPIESKSMKDRLHCVPRFFRFCSISACKSICWTLLHSRRQLCKRNEFCCRILIHEPLLQLTTRLCWPLPKCSDQLSLQWRMGSMGIYIRQLST